MSDPRITVRAECLRCKMPFVYTFEPDWEEDGRDGEDVRYGCQEPYICSCGLDTDIEVIAVRNAFGDRTIKTVLVGGKVIETYD